MSPEEWEAAQQAKQSTPDFGATFGTQGDLMFGTSGSAQAPEMSSAAKFMFQPSERTEFNWEEVGTSAKIGAGIGGVAGAITGNIPGAVLGTVSGGVLSAIGNVAEQLTRQAGYPESVAMGAGFAAGAGAGLLTEGVKSIAKKVTPSTMAYLPPAIRTAMGVAKKGEEPITIAERTVREKLFGVKPEFVSSGYAKNSLDTQSALKEAWYGSTKQIIPEDKLVGDYVKDVLIQNVDNLSAKGKPFVQSEQIGQLGEDLDVLVARKLASKSDVNYIAGILKNQTSNNPRVREKATQDILNLLQHGGTYYKGGVERQISPQVQDSLRSKFSDYLTQNTGEDLLGTWNKVLRAQHVAAARDSIPNLLQRDLPIGGKEFKTLVNNIKQSPEALEEFKQAVRTQIGSVAPDRAMSSPAKVQQAMKKEFYRLEPLLKKSGLMSTKDLDSLQASIINVAPAIRKEQIKGLGLNVLRAGEIGGAGAGLGSVAGYATQEEQ